MTSFVDLVTAFPAVIFTGLLAVCLAWWLVATVAGVGDGVDAEPEADGALDDIGEALGISSVPPAIGLSVISFVGWVVTLAVTAGLRAADAGGAVLAAAGFAGIVLASVVGVLITRPLARRAATLFVTELAPSEREAVGAFARVRSPEVDDDDTGAPGEVVVITGSLRGATFRAKAGPGRRYTSGATVHIVDADGHDGQLVVTVDDVPHELAP